MEPYQTIAHRSKYQHSTHQFCYYKSYASTIPEKHTVAFHRKFISSYLY